MNFFLTHRQKKCTIKRVCTVLGKIWGACFNALGEGPIPQKFSNKTKWVQLKGFCQKIENWTGFGVLSVPFQLRPQLLQKHQISQLLNCTGEIWGMSLRALGEGPRARKFSTQTKWVQLKAFCKKIENEAGFGSFLCSSSGASLKKRQIPFVISPVNLLYWEKSERFA